MKGVIESFEFLKGLPFARYKVVKGYEELTSFSFPYYLKADVGEHKLEVGAVKKCCNHKEARANLLAMHKKFPKLRIMVQEGIEGIEMIVGLKEDAVFGKLLVVGFGGIFADVKKEVSFRALPVTRNDVKEMVQDLKSFGIFRARGKKYDLEKFYTLIEKVAILGEKKDIRELDLNPVMVSEKDSRIVDARVEV